MILNMRTKQILKVKLIYYTVSTNWIVIWTMVKGWKLQGLKLKDIKQK